jgi:hypothetical protein
MVFMQLSFLHLTVLEIVDVIARGIKLPNACPNYLPPVHGTGAEAAYGQAVPARHAVQLNFAPPSEYIPAGQGTFECLQTQTPISCIIGAKQTFDKI